MSGERFAGAMSGTSLDGVDALVAEFAGMGRPVVLGAAHLPFPIALRRELHALQASGFNELERAATAANELAELYSTAIVTACDRASVPPASLVAAGVHGQTVRHRPERGYTIQLNNPARVAERAGVAVVADFRSRDVAAGGQGAPLVPAFHAAVFRRSDRHRGVVNVGGIANVTDLPVAGEVRGFDTGPGNVLLDLWYARHRGGDYDRGGEWAAGGRVDADLLAALRSEPYFDAPPPKSTGRDLFNGTWLDGRIRALRRELVPQDVQATLVALTARSVADAIVQQLPEATEVLICGGGARNDRLLRELSAALAPRRVTTTASEGVPVEHVEALAFAWLAREALAGHPGNLPGVTGARGPRVLGAIYPR